MLRKLYPLGRKLFIQYPGKGRIRNLSTRRFLRLRAFLPARLDGVWEKNLVYHFSGYTPFTLRTFDNATEAEPMVRVGTPLTNATPSTSPVV